MRITLIDYGAANLPSVEHAFQQLGVATERANMPEQIAAAKALVLPGAGRFSRMMHTLQVQDLHDPIRIALGHNVPFLGIALGMQALFEGSEDAPESSGFGIFPGRVSALPENVRAPHLGWNRIDYLADSRLLRGISPKAWFYFAHAFAAPMDGGRQAMGRVIEMRPSAPRPVAPAAGATASCNHGVPFVAAAEHGRVFAVQFHPEKSGGAGLDVLRNFLEAAR